jgi:hypothetical protein
MSPKSCSASPQTAHGLHALRTEFATAELR